MCHRHKMSVENFIMAVLHAVGMRLKYRTYGTAICGLTFFYRHFAPMEQSAKL